MNVWRKMIVLACAALLTGMPALAQEARRDHPAPAAATTPPNPLPPPSVTTHVVDLPGRSLRFKATAGAIRLSDAQSGNALADIGYVAFELDGADVKRRPLTFAINGGPGSGSAWLDLGALGPWRLPATSASPSGPTAVIDNADTWLDFTDLVFIDPPGTGYSRILAAGDDARRRFYSIAGDIDTLSVAMRKWLTAAKRLDSPKFIVGESYGGFRAPKLARKLQDEEGIGVQGLVLISPVLDFALHETINNPLIWSARLPSLVAAARGTTSKEGRASLADVEAYAIGPYIADLLRGPRDAQAQERIAQKIAGFTGLDPAFVRERGGRVDITSLMRARLGPAGRIASRYDTQVTGYDPAPFERANDYADPLLEGIKTRFAAAMMQVTAGRLGWPVDARYEILNEQLFRQWDWNGRARAEVVGDISRAMALDPALRVLVAHGLTDQVTPYFASKMMIDQVPVMGDPDRLRLAVYGGGHMLYFEDAARAALRDDGRRLIQGE